MPAEPLLPFIEATLAALEARFGPAGGDDRELVASPADPTGRDAEPKAPRPACICPGCRLIQAAASHCRSCGRPAPLAPSDPAVSTLILKPSLLPWRRRASGVDPLALFTAGREDEPRARGLARRVRALTTGHVSDTPCLVSGLAAGKVADDVVLRLVRSEPFMLERADGTAVLVAGELVVVADAADETAVEAARLVLSPAHFEAHLPSWLVRLGLRPTWHSDPGYALFETLVRDGDDVEVFGQVVEQFVPGANGPRDVALAVVNGRPGRPVVVRAAPRSRAR